MRIDSLYETKFVISFEIFPPRTPEGEKNLWNEIKLLAEYKPDFVSVTYGAGGSTRDKTVDIALRIRDTYKIQPLLHFTCVGTGKDEIYDYINKVRIAGISSILALRGDPPKGETSFTTHPNGFSHADELIRYIRSIDDFTIAAAAYPEGHIEASSLTSDIENLKRKVDSGAKILITQLFYDNNRFYDFMDAAVKAGVHVPIIPGIMPVTSAQQVRKSVSLSNSAVPAALSKILVSCGEDKSFCTDGLEFSINQCRELMNWGVPGLHLYTLNKSGPVIKIMQALNLSGTQTPYQVKHEK